MVSAVIVGLASANAERSKQDTTDAQSYMTVVSALRFASSGIFSSDNLTFNYANLSSQPAEDSSKLVESWIQQQAWNVAKGNPATPLTIKISADKSTFSDVSITYTMDSTYNIDVTASLVNQDYAFTPTATVTATKDTGSSTVTWTPTKWSSSSDS